MQQRQHAPAEGDAAFDDRTGNILRLGDQLAVERVLPEIVNRGRRRIRRDRPAEPVQDLIGRRKDGASDHVEVTLPRRVSILTPMIRN